MTSYWCSLAHQTIRYLWVFSFESVLTNRLSKTELKVLAESDVHEVVEDIQEIPSDFLVIESHLFSVGLQQPVLESAQKWSPDAFTRTLESVKSMLWGKHIFCKVNPNRKL